MPRRHPRTAVATLSAGLAAVMLAVVACAPSTPPGPSTLTTLNVGLGYIPSVQFAA